MSIKIDIKNLATLKIKIDLLKEKYKKDSGIIKNKMIAEKENKIDDPGGYLTLVLTPNTKRSFSVSGVRKNFPDDINKMIQETIIPKEFDKITKEKGEYIISESIQKKCFSSSNDKSLRWTGLDVHKFRLTEEIKKQK